METKFNFKSQICTSKSQSETLLKLGLKKETADMCHIPFRSKVDGETLEYTEHCSLPHGKDIPAWSLHRLILMTPKELIVNNGVIFPFRGTALMDLTINDCDLYEGMVQIIERCIKEGYFPKEYLEE